MYLRNPVLGRDMQRTKGRAIAMSLVLAIAFFLPSLSRSDTAGEWALKRYQPTYTKLGFAVPAQRQDQLGIALDEYGKTAIHLFFDGFGQSLLATPPNGVPDRAYVVHIVYPKSKSVSYSIRQTGGRFDDRIQIVPSQSSPSVKETNEGAKSFATNVDDEWFERVVVLRSASTDMTFEINKTVPSGASDVTTTLSVQEIPVARTYNVSVLVGFLRSDLPNPTYKLSPSGEVLTTDDSDRGLMSLMATFYASPTVWGEALLDKLWTHFDPPHYKLYGRNFLDDHSFFERIFLTGGVGYNKESDLSNLFLGLTWELIRGASVFGGLHYGRVNTFPTNLSAPLTEDEFNAYKGNAWDTGTAFGVNIDVLVVKNLLGQQL